MGGRLDPCDICVQLYRELAVQIDWSDRRASYHHDGDSLTILG